MARVLMLESEWLETSYTLQEFLWFAPSAAGAKSNKSQTSSQIQLSQPLSDHCESCSSGAELFDSVVAEDCSANSSSCCSPAQSQSQAQSQSVMPGSKGSCGIHQTDAPEDASDSETVRGNAIPREYAMMSLGYGAVFQAAVGESSPHCSLGLCLNSLPACWPSSKSTILCCSTIS